MGQELEQLIARASDPRWIPAIHEYCDRRCGRCRFNDRCFTFAEQRMADDQADEQSAEVLDSAQAEAVAASLEHALGLLRALAEREGIEPAGSTPELEEQMDARMALVNEPLVIRAREYAIAAARLLQPFASTSPPVVSSEVRDAVESIRSLSFLIASKVYRAVSSTEHPCDRDQHPTQNDAHGSAKVVRVAIAESLAAWRVLNNAGHAPAESPTRAAAAALERIDHDLAERIPRAMEFIRPGFDEPIPGSVRPWSMTAHDERGDRRFLAASGILARLKDFGRGLLPPFARASETVNTEPGAANAERRPTENELEHDPRTVNRDA